MVTELFRLMLLQRTFEERTWSLYRQGRISGSMYDGLGQEAVAAAAGLALEDGDVVAPLNRELATHFARGVTVADAFRQFLGRGDGPTFGRDGNMHFGAPARGVFPLVSMLGNLCPVVVGAALAFKRRGEPHVALTFLGEGAFSVGDVHEGLNLAGVWQVPAVFVLQSNGYSYSTPSSAQMVNTNLAERIQGGWSIPCERIDGTDAVLAFGTIKAAIDRARAGEGPQAVECVNVPSELRASFPDPIERLEAQLGPEADAIRRSVVEEVAAGLAEAEASPAPDPAELERGIYANPL